MNYLVIIILNIRPSNRRTGSEGLVVGSHFTIYVLDLKKQ